MRVVALAGELAAFFADGDLPHRHLVLRERAGLVSADDRGAAEGFYGWQLADDGAPPRHARDADRERDGDGGGQTLGNRADGERDGGGNDFICALAVPHPQRSDHRGEREDEQDQLLPERFHLPRERRFEIVRARDQLGDAPDLRVISV